MAANLPNRVCDSPTYIYNVSYTSVELGVYFLPLATTAGWVQTVPEGSIEGVTRPGRKIQLTSTIIPVILSDIMVTTNHYGHAYWWIFPIRH